MRPTGRWGPELGPGHPHPPSQGRAWDPKHPPSRILGGLPSPPSPGMAPRPPCPRLQPGSLPPCSPCTGPGGQTGTFGSQPAGAASTGPAVLASCRPKRLWAWHVSWRDRRVFCSQNTALRASSHKAALGTPWRGSRGSPSAWPWEACGPAPMGAPTGGGSQLPPRAGGKHARSGGPDASWRGSPGALGGAGAHSRPSSLAWASAGAVLRTRRHHHSRGGPLGLGPGLHPRGTRPLMPAPQPSAETGCEKALYPPQHHLGRDRDEGGAQPSGTLASAPEAWRPPGVSSWADEAAHGVSAQSSRRAPRVRPRGRMSLHGDGHTHRGSALCWSQSPSSLRPDHTHGLLALHHPPAGRVCSTGLLRTSTHD